MTLQPIVRVVLTALAAGIGAAATQIDNETLRIVAAVLVPTLAALGIIPPQIPTKTVVVPPPVDSADERGYGAVEVLLIAFLVVVIVLVLLRLA